MQPPVKDLVPKQSFGRHKPKPEYSLENIPVVVVVSGMQLKIA